MIEDNKAKREAKQKADSGSQGKKLDSITENDEGKASNSVKTPEKKKRKTGTKAARKPVQEELPGQSEEIAAQLMNPADFRLPSMMYFNVETPENPIFQAFNQGPNPDEATAAQTVNNAGGDQSMVTLQGQGSTVPTLAVSQLAGKPAAKNKPRKGKKQASPDKTPESQANSMFSPKASKLAQQLMLEEKVKKALAERDRITQRRKKGTPVKFKRHSKLVANQLISTQRALESDEEYETVSESGDSPPKVTTVAKSFGL